jgi:dipeptidyl aminopeptidase/acylaminoacyl peptidase
MRLRSISDVRISPDGQRVAYVVSEPSLDKNVHEANLYMVPAAGGSPTRMTYGTRIFSQPRPAPHLRWSPDGTSLSFIALIEDRPQVVVMSMNGGEARAVTSAKEGTTIFEWSPDGKRVAYLAPDPAPGQEEARKKDKSFVIEVDRNERPPRIWVQDLAGGTARALTPADHFVAALFWSPDGSSVAYAASPMGGFNGQFHTRIYAVPLSGGEPRAVVDREGMNTSPQYSPDGRWIGFISTGGVAEMVSTWGLHVAPAAGGAAIRNLSQETGNWVGEFVWTPDSRRVLLIPNEGTAQRGPGMFEQPIFRAWIETGRTERVTPGPTVNYSVTLSRDGKRMAYRSVEALTMGDVYVQDLGGPSLPLRVTDVNPELRDLALGELKPIRWTSFDGMEIWGLLLTPPGYAGGKLPLLVYCHGGPIGGFTYGLFPQFMHTVGQVDIYPTQAMASAGMAVLFPMPRGGSGYGLEGFRMIKNAWGVGDYKDIMAGVDHLVAQGLADPDRLGVMGGSYGGYMTNWIVTQTGRFKAASTMCSVSDIADLYYLSDAGDFTVEYFGLPWEKEKAYADHSPVTHVAKVTTPLLIQHGENDRRVPIMQAHKFYKALKKLGKTVEMEIYPRGGHVLFEPAQEREIMRRNLEWFRKWLNPGPLVRREGGGS